MYKKHTSSFVNIKIEEKLIETTPTHLFTLENGEWRAAENLNVGDNIITLEGTIESIDGIEKIRYNENKAIYDLNVDENHTYFVSELEILVHNDCTEEMTNVAKRVAELLDDLNSGKIKLHELSSDEQLKVAEALKDKSPLKIEGNANIAVREKNGYDDIQYKWSDGGYNYEMRWHTATPNAPADTPPNWRVDRSKPGFPGGKYPVTGEKLKGYPSVKETLIWPENGELYYVSKYACEAA